ncbi:hypothetical protein [Kiloniella sp. b19]|uniref:hypothetical protein n=1 Tax=Kiloniella sp. GXU_MW_B19 TaxID=3141326 RepID=UPI0031D8F987
MPLKTSVDSLVRVSNYRLDEAREELLQRKGFLQRMEEAVEALDLALERERAFVQSQPEMTVTFPAYIERYKQERAEALERVALAQQAVDEAQQIVRDFFLELKKYEEAQKAERERLQRELDLKEQIEMDEMGTQLHRRASRSRQ